MHQGTTGRTRPVIDRRNNKAVREIAKLRARRAARLAAAKAEEDAVDGAPASTEEEEN